MGRGVITGLILLLPTAAPAGEWPGWRGPEGNGVSLERGLPTHWSATDNVRWKVALDGAGVSAPVVWKDRVFLTASEGRLSDRLHVVCFQRSDGHMLWHARFFGSAPPEGQFPEGGMAVPTPATDGQRLCALFGTGDLVCLDLDGRPVWVRSLAQEYGPFRNRWGMAASPLLVGDLLVIQVDHWGPSYLLGVNAATGANRWRTERVGTAVNWTSPVAVRVNGKAEIITAGSHRVRAYDADTGAELWTVSGLQQQCIPSPVVSGDRVYAVSGRSGHTLAIRLEDGRGERTASHIVWKKTRGSSYVTSPVCYEGCYYQVREDGLATCMDADSGRALWQERLGGDYHASLVAGDGKVYFTSLQGVVSVVQAGRTFRLLARNNLGESVVASPALSDGQIFLRGSRHLYCIGPKPE
jgi:outer membrane protein assembly factor BamB